MHTRQLSRSSYVKSPPFYTFTDFFLSIGNFA
nr:MAG TPA: hypothetical protein [Caudoviricetes sp.]